MNVSLALSLFLFLCLFLKWKKVVSRTAAKTVTIMSPDFFPFFASRFCSFSLSLFHITGRSRYRLLCKPMICLSVYNVYRIQLWLLSSTMTIRIFRIQSMDNLCHSFCICCTFKWLLSFDIHSIHSSQCFWS